MKMKTKKYRVSSGQGLLNLQWLHFSLHHHDQFIQPLRIFNLPVLFIAHLGILNYFVVVTIFATATVQLNLLTEDAGFMTQGQQWILSLNFHKETYEGKVQAVCF